MSEMVIRRIGGWHTECGSCGYGRGGWAASPAREGKVPLSTDSPVCHGCGRTFTHEEYTMISPGFPAGPQKINESVT
jgi:transposase-like protein